MFSADGLFQIWKFVNTDATKPLHLRIAYDSCEYCETRDAIKSRGGALLRRAVLETFQVHGHYDRSRQLHYYFTLTAIKSRMKILQSCHNPPCCAKVTNWFSA